MDKAIKLPTIQRFFKRLHLPKDANIKLTSFYDNENKDVNRSGNLELYHAIRESNHTEIKESILENGFRQSNANKGYGVYFASHSRYSLTWAGSRNTLLICNMSPNTKFERFHSEIFSPNNSFEYVFKIPKDIKVSYAITYEITNFKWDSTYLGYTKYGNFGCKECDNKKTRCDCKLNSFCVNDIITSTQ